MTLEQFRASESAQRQLFTQAQLLQANQWNLAAKLLQRTGIKAAEVLARLKRDTFEAFCDGVAKKVERKRYTTIGQMGDIARGRINLRTWGDVQQLVGALQNDSCGVVLRKNPRSRAGVEHGYPRYHIVLSDPEIQMTFEWQVGTKATAIVFEHADPGLQLHGIQLKEGMKPCIHDFEYAVFKSIQDHVNPEVRALALELGIPDFRRRVAELAAESASRAGRYPEAYWTERTNALHLEGSEILRRLVECKGPRFVEAFFH